ncbi:maltose/maltodextrin ABC transporter substrate-binding protein MalE [Balneatrix alpica]|uniref:Maltodextrin-binding protein n=1 Tax=Balneatrix alpica TaxID=75684 RepID=A0ABV5ZEH1_9GAMM|nr:maltose/maltodextrin ABC transporter substrate-binding protein MalE [Balneatrix alpica]
MKKMVLAPLALGVMLGMGFATQAQAAIEEGKLVIWIGGDKGYDGLAKVGEKFTAETGIPVQVEHPDKVTDKFQQAAATGNGPDIFIWAHDRFGEWVASGLISPVEPSAEVKSAVADFTWDAVSINGKTYGYPIAVEAVGLIYNKDLISTPPSSFEDIFALDQTLKAQGKSAILWDYNNTYFSWGLLSANGGYAFKQTDSGYDVKDTGVANEGALQGAQMLSRLIEEGVMPKGADYGVMDAAINKGEVAMVINGPWAWSNLKKSGINFGVAPIPSINGKPGQAFTGVLAAALNASSPNKDLAVEFIEKYMLTLDGLKTINDNVPLGAVAHKEFMQELAADANIAATFANAEAGQLMPNVPEMGAFWAAMEPALKNLTSGRQSVEDALQDAAKRIAR